MEPGRGPARRLADAGSQLGIWIGGALLVGMTAYTLLESLLRTAFGTSTFVAVELVGYAMAPMVTLVMARTMRAGMLIRVNLVTGLMAPRLRRWLEIVCVLVALALVAYIMSLFWAEMVRNWQRGAVSETIARVPLWIPPALLFAGLPLFAFDLVLYLVELLRGGRVIEDTSDASPI